MATTSRLVHQPQPEVDPIEQIPPLEEPPLRDTGTEPRPWAPLGAAIPQDWRKRLRNLVPGWLKRRGWGLLAAILAGAIGGLLYQASSHPTYSAQAILAVPPSASAGSANEADALALTYAAALQSDDALLTPAAAKLGVPLDTLTDRLSVSVETGTAVLLVRYTAPTAAEAIQGVNTVANAVVNPAHSNSVVPLKTVNLVQSATASSQSAVFAKYGLEIGILLGLIVGSILLLVAERIDPRADRSDDIADVFHLPTASIPRELSVPEFGHAVATTTAPHATITLAPLRQADVPAAKSIKRALANSLFKSVSGPTIMVSDALEVGMAHRLSTSASLVLVVRSGERMRSVGDGLERLRLMGTHPEWVLLLDGYDAVT